VLNQRCKGAPASEPAGVATAGVVGVMLVALEVAVIENLRGFLHLNALLFLS
jgi:hypothetical protein